MKMPFKTLIAGALALTVMTAQFAHAQTAASTAPEVTNADLLWYRVQPQSHDPFIVNKKGAAIDVNKNMLHYEHTDTGGLVWNSLTITGLFAVKSERSFSGGGAKEIYSTYRGDISRTGFGGKPITAPLISDIMFEFGGDINYKDDDYKARRRFLVAGPIIYFDVPGSLTWGIHVAKEWNHNGISHTIDDYPATWNSELSYTQYFDKDHMWRLDGVFNVTGQKGKDGLGIKTKTEFYTYNTIVLDVGQALKKEPGKYDLFVGFQYWYNKFGYPVKGDPGALEFTPYVGMGIHF